MKTRIVIIVILTALVFAGCKSLSRKPAKVPPLPPNPPGVTLKSTPYVKPKLRVVTVPTPSYVPTDFALTSVRTQAGNRVVLTWQNGTPPFQPQSRPDVLSPWADFGPSTTQRSITNIAPYGFGKAFFRVRGGSSPGQLQWLTTTPSNSFARGFAVKSDRSGNVIVAGRFGGPCNFGCDLILGAGSYDAFVAKYTSTGTCIWSKVIGGTQDEMAFGVALDGQDNIIVTGMFSATVNFGGGPILSHGQTDVFVAKCSPAGSHIWSRGFGGPASDIGNCVAVDRNGDVLVGAGVSGLVPVDFGGGFVLTGHGGTDVAVVKLLGSSGATAWAKLVGGPAQDFVNGIDTDSLGDVAVTGAFGGGDLGGPPLTGTGYFTAKYSASNGNYQWAKVPGSGTGGAVACDPSTRNVITIGYGQTGINFGGGALTPGGIVLAAYDSTGNYVWSKNFNLDIFGSTSGDFGKAVSIDVNGNLVIAGQVFSVVNFGGDAVFGNGNLNFFVAAFTVSGNSTPVHRWTRRAAGTGISGANGVCFAGSGDVLSTGYFQSTVDFGGTMATSTAGSDNEFVVEYAR